MAFYKELCHGNNVLMGEGYLSPLPLRSNYAIGLEDLYSYYFDLVDRSRSLDRQPLEYLEMMGIN